jgi:hypothetical protein
MFMTARLQLLDVLQVPEGEADTFYNVSDPSQRRFSFVCTSVRVASVINTLTNATDEAFEQCAMGAGAFTATQARVQQVCLQECQSAVLLSRSTAFD